MSDFLTLVEVHFDCGVEAADCFARLRAKHLDCHKTGKTVTVAIQPTKTAGIARWLTTVALPDESDLS